MRELSRETAADIAADLSVLSVLFRKRIERLLSRIPGGLEALSEVEASAHRLDFAFGGDKPDATPTDEANKTAMPATEPTKVALRRHPGRFIGNRRTSTRPRMRAIWEWLDQNAQETPILHWNFKTEYEAKSARRNLMFSARAHNDYCGDGKTPNHRAIRIGTHVIVCRADNHETIKSMFSGDDSGKLISKMFGDEITQPSRMHGQYTETKFLIGTAYALTPTTPNTARAFVRKRRAKSKSSHA